MPASYNPTRGITYTPPRRPAAARPLETAAPPAAPASTAVVPAPPATPSLTKTSGAVAPQGAKLPVQAEATSTAGLPFRDQTVRPLPELTDEALDAYNPSGNDAQEAVMTAMREMGYDVGSANPAVKNLLDAAPAIQEAFMIQRVLGGGGSLDPTDTMSEAREYAQFVRNVVARGSMRQVAAQAARGAPAAAQQIAALPPGQVQSDFMQRAMGSLGSTQLPGVLARLYEQQYNVPGEEASGKAVLAQLQRLALRAQAGQPGAREQLMQFRP
jgi:hypothetical protein